MASSEPTPKLPNPTGSAPVDQPARPPELSAEITDFAHHIEQLTNFKQHINTQMELLQTEGLKLLEKQKKFALEQAQLVAQTATLEKQRTELLQQENALSQTRRQLAEEQTRLDDYWNKREQEIATAGRQLEARRHELERWKNTILEEEQRLLSQQMELSSRLEELEKQATNHPTPVASAATSAGSETVPAAPQSAQDFSSERQAWLAQKVQEEEKLAAKVRELENLQKSLAQEQIEWENRKSLHLAQSTSQLPTLPADWEQKQRQLQQAQETLQKAQAAWNIEQTQRQADLDLRAALLDAREAQHPAAPTETATTPPGNQSHEAIIEQDQHRGPQRQRLVRATQKLRARVQKLWTEKSELAKQRDELARHDAYLKVRADNLEHIKKLLEKQELAMARKMAEHTALRTVAAVGVFLAMLLGITFCGVYWLVAPVYRSEAIVETLPPTNTNDTALATWFEQQSKTMHQQNLLINAWQYLRQANYGGYDNREEWLENLDQHLHIQTDIPRKSLLIEYTGSTPDGVAQVSNALAQAYIDNCKIIKKNDKGEEEITNTSHLTAKAVPPLHALRDNRMNLALAITACLLAISLLATLIMRHTIKRQLKNIDEMADPEDLQNAVSDIASN